MLDIYQVKVQQEIKMLQDYIDGERSVVMG